VRRNRRGAQRDQRGRNGEPHGWTPDGRET